MSVFRCRIGLTSVRTRYISLSLSISPSPSLYPSLSLSLSLTLFLPYVLQRYTRSTYETHMCISCTTRNVALSVSVSLSLSRKV